MKKLSWLKDWISKHRREHWETKKRLLSSPSGLTAFWSLRASPPLPPSSVPPLLPNYFLCLPSPFTCIFIALPISSVLPLSVFHSLPLFLLNFASSFPPLLHSLPSLPPLFLSFSLSPCVSLSSLCLSFHWYLTQTQWLPLCPALWWAGDKETLPTIPAWKGCSPRGCLLWECSAEVLGAKDWKCKAWPMLDRYPGNINSTYWQADMVQGFLYTWPHHFTNWWSAYYFV